MDFVSKHWRLITCVVLIIAAFLTGRFTSQGVKIVEKEKVVEKVVTVAGKDTHSIEYRDRVITRVVERKPDGTTTETTVDKDVGHTDKTEKETVTVFKDRIVEREKVVQSDAPRFHANVLVGYAATKWDKLPDLAGPHFVIGLDASVRVIGPFTVGAFVLSTGVAGGSIGGTF